MDAKLRLKGESEGVRDLKAQIKLELWFCLHRWIVVSTKNPKKSSGSYESFINEILPTTSGNTRI